MAGSLVISLDFELYWGVRDRWTLDHYRENLLGVRAVVPRLLELFSDYDIHATWATVGFLFCETRDELLDTLPAIRPAYRDSRLSPYPHLAEIGPDEESDPFHYAPSLIRQIASVPTQEIGTHTFSHYYCLEPGQDARAFRADLQAAMNVARRRGISPESIVFPRNQVNASYLPICAELGIKAYRGNGTSRLSSLGPDGRLSRGQRALRLADAYVGLSSHNAYPADGYSAEPLSDVSASRFLRPYDARLGWLEPVRLRRILRGLDHAAENGLVYHLWWHPHNFGASIDHNFGVLARILDRFAELRDRHAMRSLAMRDV